MYLSLITTQLVGQALVTVACFFLSHDASDLKPIKVKHKVYDSEQSHRKGLEEKMIYMVKKLRKFGSWEETRVQ